MAVHQRKIEERAAGLEEFIGTLGQVVTGFSAGVDSTVVALAASRALGERALAVTAVTETLTPEDLFLARSIATDFGLNYREIEYNELDIEGYAENPSNRCYFCKDALYSRLVELATAEGGRVLDGTNLDDGGDYRPGLDAASEHGVLSPLRALSLTKEDVRALARHYRLPNSEKPSAPCLSSRVPYGSLITAEILTQIGNAERAVRSLGFEEFRVRHHGDLARLELPRSDFERALELAEEIEAVLQRCGYHFVALDLGGFRSGSLNRTLTTIDLPEIS